MDSKIIELLSEEIRETRNLTLAVVKETERLERHVEIAERKAIASERKADAAWEIVIMTREEIKARQEKSFWKKIFG
jgi:hypothetical protein